MNITESYNILGLSPGCAEEDVKKAFRDKAKVLHPDKGGSTAIFAKLSEANTEVLKHIRNPKPKVEDALKNHVDEMIRQLEIELYESRIKTKTEYSR